MPIPSEGEPTFRVVIQGTLNNDVIDTVIQGVRASDSIGALAQRFAAQQQSVGRSIEAEQVRLSVGAEALDDDSRTLQSHNIVREARLQLAVRSPAEVGERREAEHVQVRAAKEVDALRSPRLKREAGERKAAQAERRAQRKQATAPTAKQKACVRLRPMVSITRDP